MSDSQTVEIDRIVEAWNKSISSMDFDLFVMCLSVASRPDIRLKFNLENGETKFYIVSLGKAYRIMSIKIRLVEMFELSGHLWRRPREAFWSFAPQISSMTH